MKEEPEEGEEKPTPEQRLTDAVRDAKLALLKVRCCAMAVRILTVVDRLALPVTPTNQPAQHADAH